MQQKGRGNGNNNGSGQECPLYISD
jgi:hypothetical protein